MGTFLVARNPDAESSLPYLLCLPLEGGLWLKAREMWPRSTRVYCHPASAPDADTLVVLESVAVQLCSRRGPAIDLVLARGSNRRSQFVFTAARGRSIVLWQTPKVSATARPGVRIPSSKVEDGLVIHVDTREKWGYRFAGRAATRATRVLAAGDYGVMRGKEMIAVVERKTLEDFTASLNDGTLNYVMAELSGLKAAAVAVEGSYSALLRHAYTRPGYLLDAVGRLQVRYPSVPIVFLESRKLAEEWTFRFLRAAHAFGTGDDLALSALVVPQATTAPVAAKQNRRRARPRRQRPPGIRAVVAADEARDAQVFAGPVGGTAEA